MVSLYPLIRLSLLTSLVPATGLNTAVFKMLRDNFQSQRRVFLINFSGTTCQLRFKSLEICRSVYSYQGFAVTCPLRHLFSEKLSSKIHPKRPYSISIYMASRAAEIYTLGAVKWKNTESFTDYYGKVSIRPMRNHQTARSA
jgi:hypothetical protein